jgi:Cytochrome P450
MYNLTFSLLSFITGPHACIGRTMAIMEMKAILTYVILSYIPDTLDAHRRTPHRILIAHFSFEPAYDGQVAKPTSAVTMSELHKLRS